MAVTWVSATANPHKLAEIRAIVGDSVEVVARPDSIPDVIEDAPDLVGNARLKASAISSATAMVALADDTGLEVDALDGEPGVRSARYAGDEEDAEANMALLLERLSGTAAQDRTARFRTVLVLLAPDGTEIVAEGVVEGSIATKRSGSSGFGYDPIFVPSEGDGRTFSEMSAEEKNAISHRGRAVRELGRLIQ